MEDKENEVIDVIRNYINLEKECEANDQSMTPVMKVITKTFRISKYSNNNFCELLLGKNPTA